MLDNEILMQRVTCALGCGACVEDVHDMLIGEGLSESDAYLTYIGGKMLYDASASYVELSVLNVGTETHNMGQVLVLTTLCLDGEHYMRLPPTSEYNGVKCSKAGWNGATQEAFYYTDAACGGL